MAHSKFEINNVPISQIYANSDNISCTASGLGDPVVGMAATGLSTKKYVDSSQGFTGWFAFDNVNCTIKPWLTMTKQKNSLLCNNNDPLDLVPVNRLNYPIIDTSCWNTVHTPFKIKDKVENTVSMNIWSEDGTVYYCYDTILNQLANKATSVWEKIINIFIPNKKIYSPEPTTLKMNRVKFGNTNGIFLLLQAAGGGGGITLEPRKKYDSTYIAASGGAGGSSALVFLNMDIISNKFNYITVHVGTGGVGASYGHSSIRDTFKTAATDGGNTYITGVKLNANKNVETVELFRVGGGGKGKSFFDTKSAIVDGGISPGIYWLNRSYSDCIDVLWWSAGTRGGTGYNTISTVTGVDPLPPPPLLPVGKPEPATIHNTYLQNIVPKYFGKSMYQYNYHFYLGTSYAPVHADNLGNYVGSAGVPFAVRNDAKGKNPPGAPSNIKTMEYNYVVLGAGGASALGARGISACSSIKDSFSGQVVSFMEAFTKEQKITNKASYGVGGDARWITTSIWTKGKSQDGEDGVAYLLDKVNFE